MRRKYGRVPSQRKDPMSCTGLVKGAGVEVAQAPWPAKRSKSGNHFGTGMVGMVTAIPKAQILILMVTLLLSTACGYHTAGHSVTLPANVQTIAIPAFVNQTQTYKIEQKLTAAVVREM